MLPLSERRALARLIRGFGHKMNISRHGMEFVASWEGLRLRMYDDGGPGRGNATIGIGHLIHLGPIDGSPSEAAFIGGITKDAAYALFDKDAQRFEDFVNRKATIQLTQNQFDALVDFSFNTGGGYPAVWDAVNTKGDVCAVLKRTAILPLWAQAALKRRRASECALYMTPDEPQPEEDDMKPYRVWCAERSKTYLIGPWGSAAVDFPADDKVWEVLYGAHVAVLTGAMVDAMAQK